MKPIALALILYFLLLGALEAGIIDIPDEYPTIQEGINAAFDGDTVLVEPGTYTGPGNQNIDFQGKAILVSSRAGPDSTILQAETGLYGFVFQNGEVYSSILEGFTLHFFETAVVIESASPSIVNCGFIMNGDFLISRGGGLVLEESSAFISDCIFAYNWAKSGSSIFSRRSNPIIRRCVYYGNLVSFPAAGGIYANDSRIDINNCTFYGNEAWAIYGDSSVVRNSVFWDNTWGSIDGSADVIYSDVQGGWPGEGNIDTDPLFVDPENGDFHLLPESPCIDAGDPETPNTRWGGFRRDMGACEYDQGFYFDGQNIILKPFPMEIPRLR